jgi:microcystin-dependent protein
MAGFFGKWSKTAASNATADSTVNWAEGQAPSSVNDSARAMMASVASFRDDTSGSLVCGGTSTAYTLTTNQAFAALADMDGQEISFVVTPTNGDAATLNVNGLGAKALVSAVGGAMPAGSLIDGSIYTATYIHASSCWRVHGVIGNPYNIPLAGGMDFWGTTVPNSSFAFPIGQAISRTTYSALFAIMGTTYGVGDGSTTFNLPDRRGRTSAQLDPTGAILTSATMTPDGNSLGSKGGVQQSQLSTANLPPYTPSGTNGGISVSTGGGLRVPTTNVPVGNIAAGGGGQNVPSAGSVWSDTTSFTGSGPTFTGSAQGGTSTAFTNVQPTICCNYIIRIL